MACARGSSPDTDPEHSVSPAKRSSSKILVSSSDEEYNDSQHNATSSRRHSSRKRRKRFRKPSREEQWNAISATSAVSNSLSQLKPRKLINDFTRVTHRYNYDNVEVSGEESMEEFIKDTDSPESSDSSSETKINSKKKHRVKGYRPRIANVLESSEDSGDNVANPLRGVKPNAQPDSHLEQKECTTGRKRHKRWLSVEKSAEKQKTEVTNIGLHTEEENVLSSGEDIKTVKSARKSGKKSALDTDSNDPDRSSSSEDSHQVHSTKKSRKQLVLGSDSDSCRSSASAAEGDSQEVKSPRKRRSEPALDSDSDAGGKGPLPEGGGACPTPDENGRRAATSNKEAAPPSQNGNLPGGAFPDKNSCGAASQCPDAGCAEGSATLENSSHSDNHESTGEDGSGTESSDSTQGEGRIQKLAVQKRKKRESIFGQLKSARAKRQKKS